MKKQESTFFSFFEGPSSNHLCTDFFTQRLHSKWLLIRTIFYTENFFSVRVPPNRRRTTTSATTTTTTTTTTTGTPTTTSVPTVGSVENTRTTPPPKIFVDGFIVGNFNRNENDNALVRNENTRPNLANLDEWAWMDPERQDALVRSSAAAVCLHFLMSKYGQNGCFLCFDFFLLLFG